MVASKPKLTDDKEAQSTDNSGKRSPTGTSRSPSQTSQTSRASQPSLRVFMKAVSDVNPQVSSVYYYSED